MFSNVYGFSYFGEKYNSTPWNLRKLIQILEELESYNQLDSLLDDSKLLK